MNRIYKSVWNAVTRSWTAVSENQRAQRKGARGIKSLMTCTALFASLLTSVGVWAADYAVGDVNFGPITIGDNSENNVKAEDHKFKWWTTFDNFGVYFTTKESSLDTIGGAEGLLSLSNKGYEQILVKGGDVVFQHAAHPMWYMSYDGDQTVTQGLKQNGNKVADLVFAVGDLAYSLFNNSRDIFGIVDGETENGDKGVRFSSNGDDKIVYSDEGIALRRNNEAPQEGLWLMTLLTDINLTGADSGLTLDFSGAPTEQSLTARLNGVGNITYVGQSGNVLNIAALIQRDENGTAYNNANTYTGSTFVKGLTLNLSKQKSLGNTKNLEVTGATINVLNSSESVEQDAIFVGNSSAGSLLNLSGNKFLVGGDASFDKYSKISSSGTNGLIVVDELAIASDNSGSLTGVVSASSAELTNIHALGEGRLTVTSSDSNANNGRVHIKLEGINDQQSLDPDTVSDVFDNIISRADGTRKIKVELTNSRASSTGTRTELYLKYGDQTIEADETVINSDVTLSVNRLSQLGQSVTLNGADDISFSTLRINGSADSTGVWNLANIAIQSGDNSNREDILEVNGSGFQLTENTLNDYHGWLRLGNDVQLTFGGENGVEGYLGTAGLGLGKGSILAIEGNETVKLNRFGWSAANGGGGRLDLLDFDFENANGAAALEVSEQLALRGYGTIALDAASVLSGVTSTSGNILDLDNNADLDASNSYKLISLVGDAQLDSDMAGAENISVVGANDQPIEESTASSTFKDESGQTEIATGYWGYDVEKATDGLYLTYNLTRLHVDNDESTALRLSLTENSDKELSAQLTGNGFVSVISDGTAPDKTFKISNYQNTFQGTIKLDNEINIKATVGALGLVDEQNKGVHLVLGDQSTFSLLSGTDTTATQTLSGLTTGNNSKIELDTDTILDLALDTETTWDSVVLQGDGALTLSKGTLNVKQANQALGDDFSKRLGVYSDAVFNLIGTGTDGNVALDYLIGDGTVGLSSISATVGSGENIPNAFNGYYLLNNDSKLIFDKESNLSFGGKVIVDNDANSAATISFVDQNGEVPTIVLNDADAHPSLDLSNSQISLNWENVLTSSEQPVDVKNSIELFETQLDSASVLTNLLAGNEGSYSADLSKVTGDGHVWLNFENTAEDLSLVAGANQEGLKVGINNAKLTLSQNDDADVVNNLRLHIGKDSTLFTDGQVNLKQGLTLDSGSTLNFTLNEGNFNNPGELSYNGITLGQAGQAGELVVDGESSIDVVFNSVNIDNSLTEGVNSGSLLNHLNNQEETTLVDIITNISLDNGASLAQMEGAMNVVNKDNTAMSTVDILQDGDKVATLTAGLGVIGREEADGTGTLGIGGKVTELTLLDNKTLRLDIGNSSDDALMSVKVKGEGNLLFNNGKDDRVVTVSGAESEFVGKTIITDGSNVKLINNNALSKNSTQIIVGGSVAGLTQTSEAGSLLLETNNANVDQRTKQLLVSQDGTLDLDSANLTTDKYAHIHIASTDSSLRSSIDGVLKGNANSGVYLQDQTALDISNANISEFNGEFVGTDDAQLIYNFVGDDATWTANTNFIDNAALVLNGQGTITIQNYSDGGLSINAQSGRVVFGSGTTRADNKVLNNLTVGQNAIIETQGVLTVNNLTGNNGVVDMNLTLGQGDDGTALGANGNDGIRVQQNAAGQLILNINDVNGLKKGESEKIKLIEIGQDGSQFTPSLMLEEKAVQAITAGAYDYTLQSDEEGKNYWLSSCSNVPSDPDKPIDPTKPGSDEQARQISVTAGAYIGIAYAAQLFDVSLHDRVGNRDWINPVTGEKQSTSLWMRHSMSHERFRDSTSQLRMRSTSNVTMLGGDLVQYTTEGDGFAYAGLMGGYGTMDTKSRSKMTNLRSKSETDAWGVGAYAGWKANKDGQTGPYVDGWLMFTHASSDVTGVDRQEENIKGEGLSASIEAGWGFKLGSVETANGKYATFTLEPHASVTWFGMEYDDLHTDAQDVKFEGKNNVRTRLGTRVNMTEEGNKTFNAFAEANWVHNTQEYGATISGLTVDQTGSRNQAEGRIGVDWRITKDLSAWARVGASLGSDSYSEREGSIGVRYQF